jgi:putative Holliday junction resolvase
LHGKYLALDVGLKRIGVAVCDPLGLVARPLTTIHRRSRNQDFAQLAQLVQGEGVQAVICGLPLDLDGSENTWTNSVRKWAMRLAHALRALLGEAVPIIFWDECLSTFAANEILGGKHEHSESEEDAAAAAVILQSYLDTQKEASPPDFGRILLYCA